MQIENRKIGLDSAPFVIAEMSGNHNGELDRALAIVESAANAGAHAIKLQTYRPETMTLDLSEGDFYIEDPNSLWKGRSLYELYEMAHTPWEWHKPIFDYARKLGLIAFSSPFDATAVDFLEGLDVPCYKIASFENIDIPLIRKVAETGKPMIISTGMATVAEIAEAVGTARDAGCKNIMLLKCTSTYPASPLQSNIATIPHMRELFGCEIGLSDHTLGVGVAVASVALGACAIEKHVTLRRADGGVDAAFSLEPDELKLLVLESARAWSAIGHVQYGPLSDEMASLKFRRSLYVVEDMKAGDTFNSKNLRAVRPGYGLPPKFIEVLLGKAVKRDVPKGTRVTWDLLQ